MVSLEICSMGIRRGSRATSLVLYQASHFSSSALPVVEPAPLGAPVDVIELLVGSGLMGCP